jgi:hypothetical protein
MKEADIFESWISNLGEGTWNLPETPEQLDKLKTLMTKELIVGPDATNATEQLYDLIGDDILFDRLQELADRDPRANAWNDTEVMDRIRELGIEMPEPSAPGNPAEPQTGATAPVVPAAPAPAPQQPVAEDELDEIIDYDTLNQLATHPMAKVAASAGGAALGATIGKGIEKAADWYKNRQEKKALDKQQQQGMAEEINAMRKAAGLPVVEGRMLDESGETLSHIMDRFKHEIDQFEKGGDLDNDLYYALFDYYSDHGEIPYGIAKGRDGDPFEWVTDRLDQELGTGNHASRLPEADVLNTFEVMSGFDAPTVSEGGCNMTNEGEYCPEHGLAECATESTTAGSIAPVMGEGNNDDPMNYNAAITSSYYESKESDSLLARIKSLALLK